MKKLEKLKSAKVLSKMEQKTIKGGKRYCSEDFPCPFPYTCVGHVCEVLPQLELVIYK